MGIIVFLYASSQLFNKTSHNMIKVGEVIQGEITRLVLRIRGCQQLLLKTRDSTFSLVYDRSKVILSTRIDHIFLHYNPEIGSINVKWRDIRNCYSILIEKSISLSVQRLADRDICTSFWQLIGWLEPGLGYK